jgi:hypothetical protein
VLLGCAPSRSRSSLDVYIPFYKERVHIQGGTCLDRRNVLRCCVHIQCQPLTGLDLNGRGPDPGGLLLHPRGARDTTHQCAVVSDWRGHSAPVTGVTHSFLRSDTATGTFSGTAGPGSRPVEGLYIESELGLRHSCTITKHNCFPKYRMSGCFQLHLGWGDQVREAEPRCCLSHRKIHHRNKRSPPSIGPAVTSSSGETLAWSGHAQTSTLQMFMPVAYVYIGQRRPLPAPTLARHTYESRTDFLRTYVRFYHRAPNDAAMHSGARRRPLPLTLIRYTVHI